MRSTSAQARRPRAHRSRRCLQGACARSRQSPAARTPPEAPPSVQRASRSVLAQPRTRAAATLGNARLPHARRRGHSYAAHVNAALAVGGDGKGDKAAKAGPHQHHRHVTDHLTAKVRDLPLPKRNGIGRVCWLVRKAKSKEIECVGLPRLAEGG
eukprot:6176839-Pleurochrysis_carterae.AAC.1